MSGAKICFWHFFCGFFVNLIKKSLTTRFGDDEFIYIDISSVENGTGKVDFSNKIKGTDAPSRAKRAVKKGDILFSTVRPNLKAYGYVEREDCDCCVASTGFAVISAKTMVLSKYVYYMLYSEPVQIQLASMMGKGAYPSVNQKDVSQIQIPLPSLSIQEDFVAELDSYQKIIDGARQVVENYKPTIQNNSHWETVRLGDICELNPRKSEVKDFEGDVSFVPMAVISDTDMYFSVQEQKPLKEVYTGYTYFRDDDVLLAKVTPCFENGKSGLAKNLENGIGFGSSEFFVLRANPDRVLPEYIYYIINSNRFISEGTPQMTGTGGLRRLTKDFVLNYPVSLPPLDEQRKIVNQTEEEIAIVEQNKRLIEIFEKKIGDKISEVWGEKQ